MTLYAGTTAAPVRYREENFAALFANLSGQGGEVRNLAFAFTEDISVTANAGRHLGLGRQRQKPLSIQGLASLPILIATGGQKDEARDCFGRFPTRG